jgi:nitroreductase
MNTRLPIEKWIRDRRSTFVNGLAIGSKIDDSVIEKLLENAIWAPSHGLVQAWYFKVFAGKGVETFYSLQQAIYREITPEHRFNEMKYIKYQEKSKHVSHIIAIIARRDPNKRYPKQEDIVSVSCAVQNIYLCLQAYDIAGYLSTGDVCYAEPMREYLGLGNDDECIGFFILGIADRNVPRSVRKRISVREKTEWIRD